MHLSFMKNLFLSFFLCLAITVHAGTYNSGRLDNTHGLSNNQVECIFKDSRGFLWFGTNMGLNRYDGYKMKVYKSIKNDTTSLLNNANSKIQEDVNGNLWITSKASHVVYNMRTEKFVRNLSPLLAPLGVRFTPTIVEIDAQKNYYFYHAGDGVYKYDLTQKKLFHYKQSSSLNTLSVGTIVSI